MSSLFLELSGAVAGHGNDAGVAAHYGNSNTEQRALRDPFVDTVVDLSHQGVLGVSGSDRLSWLDSLTSQKLDTLAVGESAETLLLDPAGHVEHAIRVMDDGVTTWLLIDAAQRHELHEWLDRMRFTKRVEVEDRTPEFATFGWFDRVATDDIQKTHSVLELAATSHGVQLTWRDPWQAPVVGGYQYARGEDHPGAQWNWRETLLPRQNMVQLMSMASAGAVQFAGTAAVEALRIAAWRPRLVGYEGDEKLLPHEVDWLRSAVHMNKGCYRGQETVAKVHNLGHPPRRLTMLHLDGSESILPSRGDQVLLNNDDEKIIGKITSAGRHFEYGPIALALLKRQTPIGATVRVHSSGSFVAATQEMIVPPEAGAVLGQIPRLPRLSARRV